MNLLHLKYIIEVATAGSISKAANNLFMNQPHLSKIIKDIEESMNIIIFERTSKGVVVTKKGAEFIEQAKNIIVQVEQLESRYSNHDDKSIYLDLCIPRGSYLVDVFIDYLSRINVKDKSVKVNYHESSTYDTVKKVAEGEVNIGIIRFLASEKQYIKNILESKELEFEEIIKFDYRLLISTDNPLSYCDKICLSDLNDLIEIVYGDQEASSIPLKINNHDKTITIYQREIPYQLLERLPHAYMWSSSFIAKSNELFRQYHLVIRNCEDYKVIGYDYLIKRKGYRPTKEDMGFISELKKYVDICKKE